MSAISHPNDEPVQQKDGMPSAQQRQTMKMGWGRFAAMIGVSTVIMFPLM